MQCKGSSLTLSSPNAIQCCTGYRTCVQEKTEDHVLTFNSAIPNVSCLIFLHLMIKTVWFNLIYN